MFSCCHKTKKCYVCKSVVYKGEKRVQCVRCKIYMHQDCYDRNKSTQNYTKCNACQRVGTIGVQYGERLEHRLIQ